MILILGGTTEGRDAVGVADEAGASYYYSTKGTRQEVQCAHGIRLTGTLDEPAMEAWCREHAIRLIVDAAHPFASGLHRTVAAVAGTLQIPVIRYERRYPPRDDAFVWCDDYTDAIERLEKAGIRRLLALTGVNTIAPLAGYWQRNVCWFRILNREESLSVAKAQGFPAEQLVFYRENEAEALIGRLRPEAILTKESGYSGGFTEKAEAARKLGLPLYVVKRPPLPSFFYTVNGKEGLRKQIERLAPGFFRLRSGYTTGACATGAAKAALTALLSGKAQKEVEIALPSGETITLPVADTRWTATSAICTVIKESGDDPDVTNGCRLVAEVEIRPGGVVSSFVSQAPVSHAPVIRFRGGEGVGTVTLPGLGLEIGGPAINATPRQMITRELTVLFRQTARRCWETKATNPEVAEAAEMPEGMETAEARVKTIATVTAVKTVTAEAEPEMAKATETARTTETAKGKAKTKTPLAPGSAPELIVTLSVPGGELLAARTFNPKLGIVGGISIIGTSGIVRPFSTEAFIASIRKEAEVAKAIGCKKLVINSGAKSERFLNNLLAGQGESSLDAQAFIHYGNFIGETVRIAATLGFREVILGIMIGKAVKLAEGALDTHSKKKVMNKSFLQGLARETGCSADTVARIGKITLARELTALFSEAEADCFFPLLVRKCHEQVAPLLPGGTIRILLIGEDGHLLHQTN